MNRLADSYSEIERRRRELFGDNDTSGKPPERGADRSGFPPCPPGHALIVTTFGKLKYVPTILTETCSRCRTYRTRSLSEKALGVCYACQVENGIANPPSRDFQKNYENGVWSDLTA